MHNGAHAAVARNMITAGIPVAWADPEDPGGHGAGASRVPAAGFDTALARHWDPAPSTRT